MTKQGAANYEELQKEANEFNAENIEYNGWKISKVVDAITCTVYFLAEKQYEPKIFETITQKEIEARIDRFESYGPTLKQLDRFLKPKTVDKNWPKFLIMDNQLLVKYAVAIWLKL